MIKQASLIHKQALAKWLCPSNLKIWLGIVFLLFMTEGFMNLFASSNPVEVDVERGVCKSDGIDYPIIGFGTYPLTGKICTGAVK